MKKKLFTLIPSYIMVMLLRSAALIILVFIIFLLVVDFNKYSYLIAVLGVLISALLASYSVILNIETTRKTTIELKERELSNQIRNTFFHLCTLKMRLVALAQEKKKENISFIDIDRIFDSIEDIYKIASELKSIDIVTIAHNDMLTDMQFIYLELGVLYTSLRATRKNIVKPESQKASLPIYPNVMLTANFKLDSTIQKLTTVLLYLRDGYPQYFKNDSRGIERCAEYKGAS